MSLRLMTVDDVPKVIDYVIEVTWQDGFHQWFFTGKWEHPFHYRRWWTQYVRNLVLRPGTYVYVLEDPDDAGKILGWLGMTPGDNPPPNGVDLSKNSRRERRLRKFYRYYDALVEKLNPNKSIRNERLAYFSSVTYPQFYKTVLHGKDAHHWLVIECFVDPALPREQSKGMLARLLDVGRAQCRADGVQFWVGAEDTELAKFTEYGLATKGRIDVGTVDVTLMKWEDEEA